MIDEIRAKFDISDEEALYIKQVTEEKSADRSFAARSTLPRRPHLSGKRYRGQVNGEIQTPT